MNRRSPTSAPTLLRRRSRALARHLAGALSGDGRGVHRARVASRRLRELLPVVAAAVEEGSPGKARKIVRRLTRALGAVRELDVTLGLLDGVARRTDMPDAAFEDVRARMLDERQQRRAGMLQRVGEADIAKLTRRLRRLAGALEEADEGRWREALARRVVGRARRLRAAVEQAGRIYAADRLHDVRIAAKKLRYALEIAVESGVRAAAGPVRALKRVQDALGRLHDLQVLQAHLAAVQAEPAAGAALQGGRLAPAASALEEECRHRHAEYVGAIPALLEACEAARGVVATELAARAAPRSRVARMRLRSRARPGGARAAAGE